MILDGTPGAERYLQAWAGFMTACVKDPASLTTRGTWIEARSFKEHEVEVAKLGLGYEDVLDRMRASRTKRADGREAEGKEMPRL